MVCRPTIRTKKGNVFFHVLPLNFCYLFFMRICIDIIMLNGITSLSNFESEISMNSTHRALGGFNDRSHSTNPDC